MMSQPKQSKEKKSKAPPTVNNNVGSLKNAPIQKAVKEVKQEIKADNNKPSEKNLAKPTAEQMSIAQIIYPHFDDPSLNDKLKQVMDATQRTVDEAFTALHDSDNDPNRAVNLLLEGGNKSDEWSMSSKKKKAKLPNEKKEPNSTDAPSVSETEDWATAVNPQPNRVNKISESNRGGGRSRTYPRRGRGKGAPISENEKERAPVKKGRPELNGPTSRSGGRSFRGGRGGGRGSGGRQPFRRSFDTWNQDSQSQSGNNVFNQGVDDWVDEEYTGSLANSQVFTPSAPPDPTILHGPPSSNTFPIIQDEEESNERLQDLTHVPTSEILSHFSLQAGSQSLNKTMGLSESMLLENKAMPLTHGVEPNSTISPVSVSGLCVSKNDYIYSNVGRGRNLGLMGYPQQPDDARIQRINTSKPKPRVPPPSKIPSSAVEMPPDADSAIGLLDVQFGALEFGENSSEPVHNSPPSSRPSTPSPQPADTNVTSTITATESILNNDSRSFSPSPGTVANPLSSQMVTSDQPKLPDTTSSSLYQENVYHSSSLYAKTAPHQSIYNQEFSPSSHSQRQSAQIITSNNIIHSTSSTTLSTYASSSAGTYGNSSYPNYQYPNFPIMSSLPTTVPPTSSSSNSYQVSASAQQYTTTNNNSQSGYGSSSLGTSTYSSGYQGYNHQLNHKSLANVTPNSKEQFESSTPPVNLNSIAHSSSMSGGGNTPFSSTPTSTASKPSSASSMAKGAVVTNIPPGVPSLVGTHQYIVGQGSVPYFQQPHMYYEDLQLMPQQRLSHHIAAAGYYEMGYQPTTTREGVQQYNMTDGRFARADNTSPVQVSSMNQPSGTQTHQQQPLMNPTAIPPAYAYFYSGSPMIPGNFQFGAPALYPVAATGSSTGHGNSSSGVYGKPSNYTGNYTGMYDSNQSNVGEYKSTSTPSNKSQSTTAVNPSTASEIQMMYSKSHSALSKVGSYDKASFHCPTPPPFNLSSQNSGIAPAGGYAPQLFIPTMNPHHNTTLMHQPIHQESTNTVNSRSAINNNPNKSSTKSNYSTSNYWAQN